MMAEPCGTRIVRGGWWEDLTLRRCAFPIGPRNTASNAAYVLAGLWLLLRSADPVRFTMALALLLLGIGSAGYHGFKTVWWNNVDWAGMFACMTVLVVHGLFPASEGAALGAFSIGVAVTALYTWQQHFDLMMGALFLAASIPPVTRGAVLPVLIAAGVFAASYACWQLERRRSRLVGLWGHGLWHLGTAIAMVLLFRAQVAR